MRQSGIERELNRVVKGGDKQSGIERELNRVVKGEGAKQSGKGRRR